MGQKRVVTGTDERANRTRKIMNWQGIQRGASIFFDAPPEFPGSFDVYDTFSLIFEASSTIYAHIRGDDKAKPVSKSVALFLRKSKVSLERPGTSKSSIAPINGASVEVLVEIEFNRRGRSGRRPNVPRGVPFKRVVGFGKQKEAAHISNVEGSEKIRYCRIVE